MSNLNNSSTTTSTPDTSSTGNRHDMQDINYLLYLETMRRIKDDELNIRRQMEEKERQYEEVKTDYSCLYEKYVEIYKLVAMRHILELPSCVQELKLADVQRNMQNILNKIQPDRMLEVLDAEALRECTEKLTKNTENFENVSTQCTKLAEQKECVDAIRRTTDNLETSIETATAQTIDHYVGKLQLKEKQQN